MEGGSLYGGSNMTVLFENDRLPCSSQVLESLWLSNASPSFDGDSGSGSASMVKFEHGRGRSPAEQLLLPSLDAEDNGSEDCDGYFHQPEKKRRLRADQVQFLEKNFEVENKLEPDRKVQLAKELGLQPRQVAIWFQNRRARSKSKQLEKDYDSLKASYDKLKADYDILLKEKENLKNEVLLFTDKMYLREKEKANSEPADPIKPVTAEPQSSFLDSVPEDLSSAPMVVCKQEDASSAKSDVFDSDSPRCTEPNHCDSSHVFEPDHSDFSQDEEDKLSRSLLPPPFFPKLGYACYDDQPENCFYLGSPVEEQPSWLWPY